MTFRFLTISALLCTSFATAYAPTLKQGDLPTDPYSNPAYNQGLQRPDSTTLFKEGNQLRVTSDTAISNEIHGILTSGFFSQGYQNITYSVSDGVVTLNGHVTTPQNKISLEDRIRQVKGVVLINNMISIFDSDNK